jgi:hypothetical protein
MAVVAPMSGVPYALQNIQTTGNGDIVAPPPSFRNHTFIITASAGTTSGAIQIETGTSPTDAGTWAAITTPVASIANPVTVIASTDILVTLTGLFQFLRARISTTVAGGGSPSVTVTYNGAKSY